MYVKGTKTHYNWASFTASERSISDFCVMKFEAKMSIAGTIQTNGGEPDNVEIDLVSGAGGVYLDGIVVRRTSDDAVVKPVSTYEGSPWVHVERSGVDDLVGADALCESLGQGYRLPSNADWQAVAREIEQVDSNWNDASAGAEDSDLINQGWHGDTNASLSRALAASDDDGDGCANIFTDPDFVGLSADCGGWHAQKRTHTLISGAVLWDFSGNAYEWVRDGRDTVNDASNDGYASSNGYISVEPFDLEEGDAGSNKLMWGSAEDHTGKIHGGLGYFADGTGNAIDRGGWWQNGTDAGIFDVNAFHDASYSGASNGFRCVFAP